VLVFPYASAAAAQARSAYCVRTPALFSVSENLFCQIALRLQSRNYYKLVCEQKKRVAGFAFGLLRARCMIWVFENTYLIGVLT